MAPVIPPSELRKLSRGSFEHFIARLNDAVSKGADFGEGVTHRVVATFPDHVIVVTSDGFALRLPFTENEDGIVLGSPELLEFSSESQEQLLQVEVRETLRGLLSNDPEAEQRLASLAAEFH